MNARRRPRLFLDHKPPLVAFTVVAVACALMMVHMARSEAAPGWLRAGLGGVVGQRVIEATVLEHDPEPVTVAAGPLPVGAPSGSAGSAVPATTGGSASGEGGRPHAVGAVVGEVDPAVDHASGSEGGPEGDSETANVSEGAEDSDGPGQGHGASRGQDPTPNAATPNGPTPGAAAGPAPRDRQEWRGDRVGDRGRGHHGDRDHGAKGHHGAHDHR